jgi:7,8-dihydropterin-6-yl-methyl-4-(beta-D-ribofuranosyl)aminobenzene 5'-phosphate synthase
MLTVDHLQAVVLVDDAETPGKPELHAQHGLSMYLDMKVGSETITALMDTGPSADLLRHNAAAMDVDLNRVQLILLSHGHYDHTGGVLGALTRGGASIPVVAHPRTFDPKFSCRPHLRSIGSPVSPSEIQAAGGVVVTATNAVTLGPGILSSGKVERSTAFEQVDGFWKIEAEQFVPDLLWDDQALIVNLRGQGLVVIAGCAHAGIINTIHHAQRITGVSRVHAVLGGFHLRNESAERVAATTHALRTIDPSFIGPCHCTGPQAVERLKAAFHDRCTPLRVGAIVDVGSI